MTASTSFLEEECFNVQWKIKNFSFCCESIESPKFNNAGSTYMLYIKHFSDYLECYFYLENSRQSILDREISILTCDNSPEISKSGGKHTFLRVQKDFIFGKRRNSFLPEDTLTVRYRLSNSIIKKGKVFFCSEIVVKRKYFLWNHRNLDNFRCSQEKSVENFERCGVIKLTLKSTDDGFNTDKHLFIEISRVGGEKCYCILKVSTLNLDGIALNEVSGEFYFEKNDQQTKVFFPSFKVNELLACKNLLLPNNTLSLKCYFAISMGSLTDQASVTSYSADFLSASKESDVLSTNLKEKNDITFSELRADLKSILDDGTLFDSTLQVEGEVIKVHKNILSARSPVFRAMFTKDMKESIDRTVAIEDLDAQTVRRLLLYIYTDSICDDQWEDVKKLYFAADKYGLMSLKNRCGSFLRANISVSNVCETLVLADLHQDESLKTVALDFVSENDCAVFISEEWKDLVENHSTLAVQAMREIYRKKQSVSN